MSYIKTNVDDIDFLSDLEQGDDNDIYYRREIYETIDDFIFINVNDGHYVTNIKYLDDLINEGHETLILYIKGSAILFKSGILVEKRKDFMTMEQHFKMLKSRTDFVSEKDLSFEIIRFMEKFLNKDGNLSLPVFDDTAIDSHNYEIDYYDPQKEDNQKDENIKEENININLSYNGLSILKTNPPLFKSIYIDKNKRKKTQEEIDNDLLFLAIFNPESIVEEYVIIEKEPTSDSLKSYFIILADLISKEMNDNDEIDNIENLEKEAYKLSGCVDSLEYLKAKTIEFNNYFKYCLIRNDKNCILKDKYDYFINLGNKILKNQNIKHLIKQGNKINNLILKREFIKKNEDKICLIGCPDIIKIDNYAKKHIYVSIIRKISENMCDFIGSIKQSELDIRMALYSELFLENYKYISDKHKIIYNFIIIDKNDLLYVFEIKYATLSKWKNKLQELINRAKWHILNSDYGLPFEFKDNGISI